MASIGFLLVHRQAFPDLISNGFARDPQQCFCPWTASHSQPKRTRLTRRGSALLVDAHARAILTSMDEGVEVRMARAAIVIILALGCAVAFVWHTLPAATSARTDAARETLTPARISASERIRDEIKVVEDMLPQLVDHGAALFLLAHNYARLGEQAKALNLLR